jgi:peptidoglycan-associated lipoprotein
MRHTLIRPGFAAFIAVLALTACATKPPAPPPQAAAQPAPEPKSVESGILPGSAKDFTVNVGDTVHFDYNRYEIRDADRGILQRQATWLLKYSSARVTIEGNCDERGTREYNLALGARRAEAVKDYLGTLGVPLARMSTISYGKERPICTQSDESCWAQNRRGVTTITSGAATS